MVRLLLTLRIEKRKWTWWREATKSLWQATCLGDLPSTDSWWWCYRDTGTSSVKQHKWLIFVPKVQNPKNNACRKLWQDKIITCMFTEIRIWRICQTWLGNEFTVFWDIERVFIYHLTDKFFGSCPAHHNRLIRSIGNYSLADLHRQYKKYIHKRPKHILL